MPVPTAEASDLPGGTLLLWQVVETCGFETAWIRIDDNGLQARGRAAGQLPEPYWLTYRLETDHRYATTRLLVAASTGTDRRQVELFRDDSGWTVDGLPRPDLAEALDCDLAASPVTNTMPILRHGLHRSPGEHNFLMAFVTVPTLQVVPSRQSYTHLRSDGYVAHVRYRSGGYESELTVDADGLVLTYPTMATRVVTARRG